MTAIVLRGDARNLPLPDASVDLIVTSPPYFGQRDYRDDGESLAGQIGGERTPRAYLDNLLACTADWMRVLKPSGSIFVNLGDKYSGAGRGNNDSDGLTNPPAMRAARLQGSSWRQHLGLDMAPAKSLMGLPWRYAIRCTDELGLILRRDIIWHKLSGLPESVTDRCATRHEYVFHFTRQPRYYSAVDEIREPHAPASMSRFRSGFGQTTYSAETDKRYRAEELAANPLGKLPGSVWRIASTPLVVPDDLELAHFAAFPLELPGRIILGWSPSGICAECGAGRFPVAQAERVALRQRDLPGRARLNADTVHGQDRRAGTHVMSRSAITGYACACTPYTDHPERRGKDFHRQDVRGERGANDGNGGERFRRYMEDLANPRGPVREYHFDAWTPAPTRPAVVVDPFAGTGTTMLVASALGRIGIGVDRSADYCRLARWRTTDPGERARALGVPKPPPVPDGQGELDLFGGVA